MPPKKPNTKPLLRTDKIPLPEFLRLLTEADMSMPNAIAVAGKVYKTYNTPEKLGGLNAAELVKLGIDSQERRKEILDAVKKYGSSQSNMNVSGASTSKGKDPTTYDADYEEEDTREAKERQERALDVDERRRAALASLQEKFGKGSKDSSPSKKRKRGRDDDLFVDPNATAPSSTKLGAALYDFHEILDEEALEGRTVFINRAPVMLAWSCVVAEKLGFEREEALSIGFAYMEMNATTKGASLGIYDKSKEKGMEPGRGTAQPHVELMGRRIALFQIEGGQWRALMKGDPVTPDKAFLYLTRSLAQMHPYLMGALTLLAQSFDDPQQLNNRGYSLYCEFRPENPGWGVKQEVQLATILRLRDRQRPRPANAEENPLRNEDIKKQIKEAETFEEFEALEEEGDFTLLDLYQE